MVSNLVAIMDSTYLTTSISLVLASLSAAHLTLHSSHKASLAALSLVAYSNSATDSAKILSYKARAPSAYPNLILASAKAAPTST
jgi:hypothetical protein